jgi:hypothetical protein
MTIPSRSVVLAAGFLGVFTPEAGAQIRASERATVSQTVDGTVITVEYARPRRRGRAQVFGDEVKWEEVWTPGANMATTLELSKPVEVNGHPVPAGKYSVWIQVNQGDWVFMLDTVVNRFHTVRPDMGKVMLRFNVRPEEKPPLDVLTWWFSDVKSDRTVLAMQWDKYLVPLTIKVPSSYSTTVSAEVARPIVGSYRMQWLGPPEDEAAAGPADSSRPDRDRPPPPSIRLDVTYARGSLWGHVDPAPFPGYDTMVLLRIKDDWYLPGWWMHDELYDVSDDMTLEFKVENGKASGFEMRTTNDLVIGRASRIP